MTDPDVHTLTGPYVLDALPADERVRFEDHLAECAFCTTEVAELREAAVKLASQVAAPPPPALKADVLAAIENIRQLPPDVPGQSGIVRRRFSRRSVFGLAAAALAVAAAGGVAVDQYQEKRDAIEARDRVTAVLTQPDARTVHGPVNGGGQATVVVSARANSAVVVLKALPKLPKNRTYQLWMMGPHDTALSIGLATGDLTQVVNGSVNGMNSFGLSIEPTGGSPRPTLPPAALVPLA
ncbi:anti-sigma factor [Kribbella sp. NPDC026611]|uniref:anti-sigma factor n=1 Tax=Kribbella sp. NPDC026611 TaxID=3154911 RepID=UPI00340C109A